MKCTCQEKSACSSCQPSIVDRQEEVVRRLQDLILKYGSAPTGQLKDMAVALGVAVDKLVLLRPKPPVNPWASRFYMNQASGNANVRMGPPTTPSA